MRRDTNDFIIGETYPGSKITIQSEVYSKRMGKTNRKFVKYTCNECNSGIIYEGRVDNIRSGHTYRCAVCGRSKPYAAGRNEKWERKSTTTADTINPNNIKSNHIGEIRGDWLIQEYHHSDHQGHSHYNCLNIKNGKTWIVTLDRLPHEIDRVLKNITDDSKPENISINCGESEGEKAIRIWLTNHNILFEQEYDKFDDLIGVGGGKLRFDFKIKDKPILIEFQGEQHYKSTDFFGGEEAFQIRKIHDTLKKVYCKDHNYKLIEIPYNYNTLDEYLTDI